MRMEHIYTAYLDNFNEINIYFSIISYGGISKSFYIEDENHNQISLTIIESKLIDTYYVYTCSFEGAINFGSQYHVFHEHARKTPLIFAEIVKQPLFDELFYYDANDLGSVYTKKETTYKVWAPTSYKVWLQTNDIMYKMNRDAKGVYSYTLFEDMLQEEYLYYVEVNGQVYETQDPYEKACSANSKKSVVYQSQAMLNARSLTRQEHYCDAIIYEASVRDYATLGTFNSLLEDKLIEYVKELGATHIQLLPITDFGSVDDLDVSKYYNWGYDPISWMSLENSYSSDVHNPQQVSKDVKRFISKAHEQGLRVNIDVVFNHMYDLDDSPLQRCVPYYYYQYDKDRGYSNSSACGNDVDTQASMCSKLINDSCLYLLNEFDIDGLRFDLMGIIDIQTMNEIATATQQLKPDFMMYGEGWDMPSFLDQDQRATIRNQAHMPNVAHFSDRFRDILKGGTMESNHVEFGYLLGDTTKIFKAMNVLGASTQTIGDYNLFDNPNKAVNYVECHDNQTSWDRIDSIMDVPTEEKKKYHKLLLGTVLLSQGIPFIHGGQEFARTKGGLHNTYNTRDEVNHINWNRLKENKDIYDYVKTIIKLRKKFDGFRKNNVQDLHHNISYESIYEIAIKYKIETSTEHIMVIINPTKLVLEIDVDKEFDVLYHDDNKQIYNGKIVLAVIGIVVLYKSKQ